MDDPSLIEIESALYADLPTSSALLKRARLQLDTVLAFLYIHPASHETYESLLHVALDIGAGKVTPAVRTFLDTYR